MVKKSLKYSFSGYNLLVWAKHNKNNIKLLVSALAGFAAPLPVQWQVVVGVVSKLLLDAADYFLSE